MHDQSQNKILIVITGPTASGKTSLAVDLALHLGCDVISADSRQIFKGIPIGTAVPTMEERRGVIHHFMEILPLDAYYSAALYAEDVIRHLDGVFRTSDIALMCGGSMMYIDAVTNGIDDMPTVSDAVRRHVLGIYEEYGLDAVMAQLEICDPEYAAVVDARNPRRVLHALEICLQSGTTYTSFRTGKRAGRPFKMLKMMIDRPREELFGRIGRRVDEMFRLGLLDEAGKVMAMQHCNALNTVGYKELVPYFKGETSLEEAKAKIARDTRVYAKKQLTWLARDPELVRLSPDGAFAEAVAFISAARCAHLPERPL